MRGSLTSSIDQEVKRRYGGANKAYRVYKIEKILRMLIGGQRVDLQKFKRLRDLHKLLLFFKLTTCLFQECVSILLAGVKCVLSMYIFERLFSINSSSLLLSAVIL